MEVKRRVVFMVETRVNPSMEEKFNEWDTKIHIPMALMGPGMVSARRYKAVGGNDDEGKYLVIYELENEAMIKAFEESQERKAAHQKKLDDWGEDGFTVEWAGYYKLLPKN